MAILQVQFAQAALGLGRRYRLLNIAMMNFETQSKFSRERYAYLMISQMNFRPSIFICEFECRTVGSREITNHIYFKK